MQTLITSTRTARIIFKPAVFGVSLWPAAAFARDVWFGELGPDPYRRAIVDSGDWALGFLVFTLALTPARRLTGWHWLNLFRRMLGLFAFFYASVHALVYVTFEPLARRCATRRRWQRVGGCGRRDRPDWTRDCGQAVHRTRRHRGRRPVAVGSDVKCGDDSPPRRKTMAASASPGIPGGSRQPAPSLVAAWRSLSRRCIRSVACDPGDRPARVVASQRPTADHLSADFANISAQTPDSE